MNGEESELANQLPDDGMIASATGMRARDPWEMPQRKRPRTEVDELGDNLAAEGWRINASRIRDGGWNARLRKPDDWDGLILATIQQTHQG